MKPALLNKAPKYFFNLCHTLNESISWGYTVGTGIMILSLMKIVYNENYK